ncbi:acyl-CoA dehydrogenase family protein [Algicella marina]|uniref:Acyl-CoA dehydrogenase n=1 Tax=Algicella marina TaxID=2683284 RepID=A0A6P1SXM5_9RHOB|nr:acyl-CoA dehydrogenase family protein [Algicella marina]QHQ34400.1 acyl-CoA dehydrogenase [Algicella marina]
MGFAQDAEAMQEALASTPGWQEVAGDRFDDATLSAIFSEAVKVAEVEIAPLNAIADRVGARISEGRVTTPAAFRSVFTTLADGGWLSLEHDARLGGQGLPLTVFAAVNPLFERACPAFMMVAGGTRAAAMMLSEWADPETQSEWVPELLAGRRCATICISEPEAGSDVGRIRTRAERGSDGRWQVSGQKIWISFGDHDIRSRIGHCLLARTGDKPGTRGLSLFLVENGPQVVTERIEEKLGLHGSPTCALRFEKAPATLIGSEEGGLRQLFTMIRHMRLTVACQGLGVALACHDAAASYAQSRRQGGSADAPPVAIVQHPDVRRQLLEMETDISLFRLALLQTAVAADLAPGDAGMARLCGFLLPLIKNFGAELAFDTAARSILVLGGGGFMQDYPAAQALRDARVFAIYEGTTGMQAQDFVMRQCIRNDEAALQTFVEIARAECAGQKQAIEVIETFKAFFDREVRDQKEFALMAMAEPVMRAGWCAVKAWLSGRMADEICRIHFLATAEAEIEVHFAKARSAARLLGQ